VRAGHGATLGQGARAGPGAARGSGRPRPARAPALRRAARALPRRARPERGPYGAAGRALLCVRACHACGAQRHPLPCALTWGARDPPAGASIGVLAKIESADSVGHLEEILDAVDGAMVARGDLGAELPVEQARCRGPGPALAACSRASVAARRGAAATILCILMTISYRPMEDSRV